MSEETPSPVLTKDSIVSLREVTRENLGAVLRLKVAPEQEKFVANNAVSIAQAHFYPETAWFRAIYADETPVGFMMLSDDAAKPEYFLWRLMLDARYQKFGFAARAMELLFEYVRSRPGAKEIFTSCVPGEGSPFGFYEKLGFSDTGEMDEDEVVMRRDL
jgi:diamine N-acetyltransferase